MSSTVGGLQIGMKAILQDARMMSKSDWRVVPLDWNEKMNKPARKLRIAYYEEDDIFPLTPGVKRGLKVSFFYLNTCIQKQLCRRL